MLQFVPIEKAEFGCYAEELFAILAGNMRKIAPTGNTYDHDKKNWITAVEECLEEPGRTMLIIKWENIIVGFFRYNLQQQIFVIEEFQITPNYQSSYRIFRKIFTAVLPNVAEKAGFVDAYVNTNNEKCKAVVEHTGMKIIGKNRSGLSYHYRCTMADFLQWHQTK